MCILTSDMRREPVIFPLAAAIIRFPIGLAIMYWHLTDRKGYVSGDGQNWDEIYSTPRTTFLTADRVGFGINNDGDGTSTWGSTLVHWEEG